VCRNSAGFDVFYCILSSPLRVLSLTRTLEAPLDKYGLQGRLDEEISAAEASLQFWIEQQSVQADTPAVPMIDALVDGYRPFLKHLEAMRAGISAV
jgi:hypothetical protein